MAAPTNQKRPRRSKALLPTCYYEGFLEKRSPKETASRRLWTCLCGNTLFFYNSTRDTEYTEKLELSGFISLADDSSRGSNLEAARFSLRMKNGEVKLTASSLETRELWKGFICSVVELAVPRSLNLLPGQLHMLAEVVKIESERRLTPPLPQDPIPPLSLPLLANMPPCYHPVSRLEAEMLLEKNPGFGNFLLRPSRNGSSMAITTYQDLNGPVFKHYRVTRKPEGGFSLDVENSIPCATLDDVINLLVERTSGTFRPFIQEESYEKNITYVQSNDENGEQSLQCAPIRPSLTAPVPPPARPPKPPPKPSKPGHNPACEDSIYVNYSPDEEDQSSMACAPPPPPRTVKNALLPKLPSASPYEGQISSTSVKNALLPKLPSSSPYEGEISNTSAANQVPRPVPPLRKLKPTEAPARVRRSTLPNIGDHFTAAISDELKEKLERRLAKQ